MAASPESSQEPLHDGSSGARPSRRRWSIAAVALVIVAIAALLSKIFFGGNLHTVLPGEVYRSAQPSPAQLREWTQQLGLRSVINLKGAIAAQVEATAITKPTSAEANLEQRHVRLSARRWPSPRELLSLIDALDDAPRPTLLHCESGIDRSGLAAAVASLLEGEPPEIAAKQFSLRFGHPGEAIGSDLPGVVDAYRAWLDANERPHSPEAFRSWVRDDYVAYHYEAELEVVDAPVSISPGEHAEFGIRVTNRSPRPMPLGCDRTGTRVSIRITSVPPLPPFLLEQRTCKPGDGTALAPGDSLVVSIAGFRMPHAGHYEMAVDLVDEENEHYFGDMGSPVLRRELTIR